MRSNLRVATGLARADKNPKKNVFICAISKYELRLA